MNQKKKWKNFWWLILLLVTLVACATNETKSEKETNTSNEVKEQSLLIAAAASLETVMEEEIIPAFLKDHAGVTIEGNYDSSGKLQTQIEKGLEADIFFSAATKQMDTLVEQKLVMKDTVVPLLQNKLVMIVPSTSDVDWVAFNDLTKAETIAIGDPASVPAGQYAEKGLKALEIWDYVSEHASLGTNVTEVLNWVAASSAQVGLVYATDAASTDKVKVIATLSEEILKEPIIYPVGVVESSKEKQLAKEFIQFLESQEAGNYFEETGFTMNQ